MTASRTSAPGLARRCAAALAALVLGSAVTSLRAQPPETAAPGVIAPEPRPWRVENLDGLGRDESRNLSGLACAQASGAARPCLLVSDEERYARLVTVGEGTIRIGRAIGLLPEQQGDDRFKDTDAEAADFEGGFYYVTGSHGASKYGGRYEPGRFWVYRFPVDPATGQPSYPFTGDVPPEQVERRGRLEAILAAHPDLKAYACNRAGPCPSLQADGLNIEGLAVRDGSLNLGLRAPSLGETALVLRVGLEAVFGAEEPNPELFPLRLGRGVGIRDLVKVGDGFLVLSGPASPEPDGTVGTAAIFHWSGAGEPVRLGTLGGAAADVKPEALLLLGEDEQAYRVLVLSDGPSGGNPTEFRIPRRR